jgi:hypothetical protein
VPGIDSVGGVPVLKVLVEAVLDVHRRRAASRRFGTVGPRPGDNYSAGGDYGDQCVDIG